MVRNALVRWYKHHAEVKLREKVDRYAQQIGVEPSGVGIRTFKSRWGSCTAKGNLEFNWKIIMAPNRIVDYVVMHELCHLIHHDHSPMFWKTLESLFPSYQESRNALKNEAMNLNI
jgi:predicted metal-dependent hydrolase